MSSKQRWRGGVSWRRWAEDARPRTGGRNRFRPTVLTLEDRQLLTTLFSVTSALDTGDAGTLRDAIRQANAADGPVEIDFQLPRGTTIALTQGELELSGTGGPITIVGPGASDLAVDAGGNSRVLQIDLGVTASISGMTLSGGWVGYDSFGGGVSNQGTVKLRDVALTGNTAHSGGGGMVNDGTATLTDCTISGNTNHNFLDAGGVRNSGTLTMIDSAISDNTGVWNLYSTGQGTATLDGCIVSGAYNGVLSNSSAAGALTLTGTTVSDNSGDGLGSGYGVMVAPNGQPTTDLPTATLTDCTISGNSLWGVVIWQGSRVSMSRCSVTGNGGAGVLNVYGDGSLTDCSISGNTGPGVQSSGNITLTRCNITGNSSYVGAGVLAFPYLPGQGTTLIDCIISQNTAKLYGGGVDAAGPLTMRNCIVTGNVSGSMGGGMRTFGSATVSGCLFAGNSTDGEGGGIDVLTGHLTISDSLVTDNHAGGKGGGLNVNGDSGWWGGPGSATLTSLIVVGNSAASGGGLSVGGALDAAGVQLINNRAVDGGGIANTGTLTLDRSNLVANTASHDGGGLLNHGAATLTGVGLYANSAGSDGGGVFDDGVAVLIDGTVSGNSAAVGGGLYVAPDGTITLTRTKVKGNRGGDIAGAGSLS